MNKKTSFQLTEERSVSKEQIIEDLRKMGLKKGDHLAVALSFKSIGYVEGGSETFIDALLEVVGPEGTIMMNAFTYSFPIQKISSDYIFDVEKTAPYTGFVPRTMIARKDAVRSRHPTCSVVSIGKMADYLTCGHNETSNAFLPFEKLAKIGGKYLGIGLNDRLVGIRHEAQRRAGLFVVPFFWGVQFRNSKGKIKVFIRLATPCVKKLPKLVPKLERLGAVTRGRVGNADSIIGTASEIIDKMSFALKNDPTLNLCDDWFCIKCRELERRLNLYKRIVNPNLFQRNRFIRTVLGWRNNFFFILTYNLYSKKNSKWLKPFIEIIFNARLFKGLPF